MPAGTRAGGGARLPADLADATGLTNGHAPGRITTDLAVMIADGGETITDLAVLRDQGEVFVAVPSTPTACHLLADMDQNVLGSLRGGPHRGPGSFLAAGRRNLGPAC